MIDHRLTILLPVKGDDAFTLRWMQFADQFRFPFKIIVADGVGSTPLRESLADKSRYPNLAYEHLVYDEDDSYRSMYIRLLGAFGRIDTPFTLMVSQDDFFSLDGIKASLEFLDKHPDYSVCDGAFVINFSVIPGSSREDDVVYGRSVFNHPEQSQRISIEDDTSLGRFESHLRNHEYTHHGVQKTEALRKYYGLVVESGINDPYLSTIMLSMMASVDGKIRRLDVPYYVRQRNSPSNARAYSFRHGSTAYRFYFSKKWRGDFSIYIRVLGKYLSAGAGIAQDEAAETVEKGYREIYDIPDEGGILTTALRWLVWTAALKLRVKRIKRRIYVLLRSRKALKIDTGVNCECASCAVMSDFLAGGRPL